MSKMKIKLKRWTNTAWGWIKNCAKRLENFIIGCGGKQVFVFAIRITLFAISKWDWLTDGYGFGYAIRILVFIYGALGAFYGLILAARRLKISEAGLFNARFERGIEALASKKLHIRTAGVHILENLHKTAELANKKLIRKLLSDFIQNRAGIYDREKKTEPKPRGERVDIEAAIKALGALISKENMSLEERQTELNMQKLDLRYLNLSKAKLQGAYFSDANLQGVIFHYANLQKANFWKANLQEVWFWDAKLQGVFLASAKLQKADFRLTNLQ